MKSEVKASLERSGIPGKKRGVFVMWASRWGVYIGDDKWVEYGPLERHHKVQRTTTEIFDQFSNPLN